MGYIIRCASVGISTMLVFQPSPAVHLQVCAHLSLQSLRSGLPSGSFVVPSGRLLHKAIRSILVRSYHLRIKSDAQPGVQPDRPTAGRLVNSTLCTTPLISTLGTIKQMFDHLSSLRRCQQVCPDRPRVRVIYRSKFDSAIGGKVLRKFPSKKAVYHPVNIYFIHAASPFKVPHFMGRRLTHHSRGTVQKRPAP